VYCVIPSLNQGFMDPYTGYNVASLIIELDEERKAAMVSNLLFVLCSEQTTQQS